VSVLNIDKSFVPLQQDIKARVGPEGKPAVSDKNSTDQEQLKNVEKLAHKLEEAVEQLNKTVETYNTELKFTIHKESGQVAVKVIDTRDKSVIREIPPERVLEFAAYVKEMLGVLFDKFI